MRFVEPSPFRRPKPQPLPQPQPLPRRTDGSIPDPHSDILSKESMTYDRIHPYYFRRCKKGRATSIDSLPSELLFEILIRLPAHHLYDSARLVCRKWRHIIYADTLINTQIQDSTYGLLLLPRSILSSNPVYATAAAEGGGGIHTSELAYIFALDSLAPCNGLVLELRRYAHFLPHLVNPATKRHYRLPPPVSKHIHNDIDHCGFAYAAASMEYKVVVPYMVAKTLAGGLDILTVGVDESWRQVETGHLPAEHVRLLVGWKPMTSEGYMHWGRGRCCLTMNMETEVITVSEAPLVSPDHDQYDNRDDYYYLSTGKYLSVMIARGDLSWEVWDLEAETGEWRKALPDIELGGDKCRLQQFACEADQVLEPVGWVKYPEILALSFRKDCRACIFYNLDTNRIDSIELPKSMSGYSGLPHKNNLIWLSYWLS